MSFHVRMFLRKLSFTQSFCLAICLVILFAATTNSQTEPALTTRNRILEALEGKKPGWKYGDTLESTYMPRVPSEKRILAGQFINPKSPALNVRVSVYRVESREEAVEWLRPVRDKIVAEGWQMSVIQIGDEGYLGTYKDGKRFQIEFRRGTVVADLSADDLTRAKDFAQFIAEQIAAQYAVDVSQLYAAEHSRRL